MAAKLDPDCLDPELLDMLGLEVEQDKEEEPTEKEEDVSDNKEENSESEEDSSDNE